MNGCENCRHTNHLGLPDWSTMPCAACARFGADNAPTMWEAKPQTNYDRIISKTPEELAEFLIQDGDCPSERMYPDSCPNCDRVTPKVCYDCWLDWLQKEATE